MIPTAIDVFSGCGGLTQGLKQAGFRVLSAIELDEIAVTTYGRNHPDVRVLHADVRDVSAAYMRELLGLSSGSLDLLAGCPPCQGFSTLRTLNGKRRNRDRKNNLLFEFLRLVRGLRP